MLTFKLPGVLTVAALQFSSAHGASALVALTPDNANSSPNSFGGSLERTLDDPFDYDADAPNENSPNRVWAPGSNGYHANLGEGQDALLSYTLDSVTITTEDTDLVVDLYGRIDCCDDRDDDIDVQVFDGNYDTPIATVSGLAIDNAGEGSVRATFDSLPVGSTFDRIRIVGKDSGGGASNNYFTLLELRVAVITPDDDSDGDGLPDFWEIENGLDPDDDGTVDPENGPSGDPDNDDLNNLGEFENRTDPKDDDSDDDTLLDGDEVSGAGDRPATDPLDPDTDDDGLDDAAETNTGSFADAGDTGSNPTLVDSDNDGEPDAAEVGRGTDPSDPNVGGNLALGKVGSFFNAAGDAAASWGNFAPSNINDGDPVTISHPLDQVSSDYYYEIDLEQDTSISHVILTGRGFRDGCCPDRLENITLVVLNAEGSEVFSREIVGQIIMSEEIDLSDAPPFGRYVRVINSIGAAYGPQLGEIAIIGSSSPPVPLMITSFLSNPETGEVTLTWNSQPGAEYSIFSSEDLVTIAEINDSVSSQGATTTVSFTDPEMKGKARYFYHVGKN